MTTNDHARVLYAYLSRVSLANTEEIHKTKVALVHAAMNCDLSVQIDAQKDFALVIQAAVGHLIDHDKNNIQRTIENVM